MAKRKIEEKEVSVLEQLVYDSLHHIGLTDATPSHASLLLRLIFSGIGKHFFYEPDTNFRLGFIDVRKSPEKDELFTVNIIRSEQNNIVNADTLWKYYSGELLRENQLKEVLDNFVKELLLYSQSQEVTIGMMTQKLQKRKGKENGI